MKTILIPFFDDDAAQSALSYAFNIAQRFNSHIEGMFVAPRPAIIDGGIGMSTAYTYATQMENDGLALAESAKSRFQSFLTQHNINSSPISSDCTTVSAAWQEFTRSGHALVGENGRVYDLIIVGRGFGQQWTDWITICESALFESGRPVLITPQETGSIGEHVAIAWNGSTETARTVALGMPFLQRAKTVSVVTLTGWSVPGPDGDQLVKHLLRNGIHASLHNFDPEGRSPGHAIIAEATGLGVDLLVKGAYTQSRLRQLVFGGATRHILHEASLPVFMAH